MNARPATSQPSTKYSIKHSIGTPKTSKQPKQYKSLVLQFEAAMRLAQLSEQSSSDDIDVNDRIISNAETKIGFHFYDEMLSRYSAYARLGMKIRSVLWQSVYCINPARYDAKRDGEGPATYVSIAEALHQENENLRRTVNQLRSESRDMQSQLESLSEELKLANHLKVQFVELEHSLRQNSSINRRLRKANDTLLTHNEDLEQQLLRATRSKFNVAVEEQLKVTVEELFKARKHSSMLSDKLEKTLKKNRELLQSMESLREKANSAGVRID
eukprot:CAMPEP_0184492456 /NCGR_PEP_ID=MMETSP0113_2-20130426/23297_1 /TAXON_ID=91329 /ORGANISM="Norrisiella sphaerica, Strain BC52" /LENGTH=271 /DNA_ID=CAMNT_0026877267 /DNA_START=335 /DNA_END=1150 /DNA_ORIENTATION=+